MFATSIHHSFFSKLTMMVPVESQFKPISTKQELEQSRTISTQTIKADDETEDSDSFSEESDDSGDYTILFAVPEKPGKYKPKFFDKEGYDILSKMVNRLEKKQKKKKKKPKKRGSKASLKRSDPVGVSRGSVIEQESQTQQQQQLPQQSKAKEEVVVDIPMRLDLTKPPPPSGPVHEVNQHFKLCLDTLATRFGHLQPDDTPHVPAGGAAVDITQVTADASGRTTSAPTLTTQTVSRHACYSEQRHPRAKTSRRDDK